MDHPTVTLPTFKQYKENNIASFFSISHSARLRFALALGQVLSDGESVEPHRPSVTIHVRIDT